jgi:hypothetical protein
LLYEVQNMSLNKPTPSVRLAGGGIGWPFRIVLCATLGSYVIVEGHRTWKDPGDTKRDLVPAVAFQASTSSDTGGAIEYAMYDTVLEDRSYRLVSPSETGIHQLPKIKIDKSEA